MDGLIHPDEGELLASLAAQVPAERTIVEVGSYWGLSTCWLAHGARGGNGAHIVDIDPWQPEGVEVDPDGGGVGEHTFERFKANVSAEGLWPQVTTLRTASPSAAAMWVNPLGLLWIDGLHGYWDVRNDFEAWVPKVEPGGWVVCHDYYDDWGTNTHPSQVADAINDVIVPMDCWEDVAITVCTWSARRAE